MINDQDQFKRPNTKNMVSRRFRCSRVSVRIINAQTDQLRTADLSLIDKADPVKAARERVRLQPGEMILRVTVIEDRYVIVTQSPEEFIHYGRVLEYIPIQRKDQEPNENH